MNAMRLAALALVALSACPSPPVVRPRAEPLLIGRGSAAEGEPSGVRFLHPPPAVGTRWRVALSAESRTDDGDEQISQYLSEYTVEIVAVDGPSPSRMKVHVERNVNVYQGKASASVVDGKDYVVDAAAPHVRDGSGAQAPAAEARRVLDWFPDLGARSRVDEILPDESMHVGDRRDALAAAILRIMHATAWKLDAGQATLARADADVAVFDVTLETTSEAGMKMRVSGAAKVRLRDSWLVDLELRGTYAAEQSSGSFELRRVVTALAPASKGP